MANQAFMEPVDGIEMVPKSRWKLVSELSWYKSHVLTRSPSRATSAGKRWVHASNAVTRTATLPSTLPVDAERGYI